MSDNDISSLVSRIATGGPHIQVVLTSPDAGYLEGWTWFKEGYTRLPLTDLGYHPLGSF